MVKDKSFWKEILIGVLSFVIIASLTFLGNTIKTTFDKIDKLDKSVNKIQTNLDYMDKDLNSMINKLSTFEAKSKKMEIDILKLKIKNED